MGNAALIFSGVPYTYILEPVWYLATQNHQKTGKKPTSIIIMKVDFLNLPVVTDAKIVPCTLTNTVST